MEMDLINCHSYLLGNQKKPKGLDENTGNKLCDSYYFNSKSWTSTGIFLNGFNHLIHTFGKPEIEKHF